MVTWTAKTTSSNSATEMHEPGASCTELVSRTGEVLTDVNIARLFMVTEGINIDETSKTTIRRYYFTLPRHSSLQLSIRTIKDHKYHIKDILLWFPHIWVRRSVKAIG
jgi:hypothetical protein